MPTVAFDMTPASDASRRLEFRGKNNVDYYEGDFRPLVPGDVSMKIEKSLAGEYAIYKLISRSGLTFRRSWPHIRSDKTNVTVFWFICRGQMTVSHPGGTYISQPGDCAITRSTRPFYMELKPDETGVVEAMHVVVPSHRLYGLIGENLEVGRPFPTQHGDLLLAERIFGLLFEEDELVDPETSEQLVQALLKGLGRTISEMAGLSPQRSSIPDRRVADITRYISQHFANPDLNAKKVASSCGISLRYLCHILKKNELAFSTLVWDARMNKARDWLMDASMRHYSICEIAYLVGFKSSAHFSRMFKSRYEVGPREFRNQQQAAAEVAEAA